MAVKDCCKDPVNLEPRPDHPDARKDLMVKVCLVCGARHFELTAEPGVIGIRGGRLG